MGKAVSAASPSESAPRLGRLAGLAGFLLGRAVQWDIGDLMATLEPLELRPPQYVILAIIGDNPGLSQMTLSQARGSVRSGLVPLLDSLEARGMLKRVVQASDRRLNGLYLTDEGQRLLEQADALVHEHEQRLMAMVGPEDYQHLVRILGAFGKVR